MSDRFVCDSCDKPKNSLRMVRSALIDSMKLFLCESCMEKGYEPRFVILVHMASFGNNDDNAHYITDKKYVGEEIVFDK